MYRFLLSFYGLSNLFVAGSRHGYPSSASEEYDFSILDPLTVYGSPYGGFSRATSSRLASLPLHLPELSDEHLSNPVYTQVRDFQGRLHVCRVYHEDELAPESFDDSIFDKPQLHEPSEDSTVDRIDENMASNDEEQEAIDSGSAVIEAVQRLKRVEGICGQIHKGWWSYEWCHENDIDQFHIDITGPGGQVEVKDVTNLGRYKGRAVNVDFDNLPPNELAEDLPELARVVDLYSDGDLCPETNQPRVSWVNIQCCSDRVIQRRRGLMHKNQEQTDSTLIALMDIVEDPDQVCVYNATVCTTLLCADGPDSTGATDLVRKEPKENETVREILDRTLGTKCLQSAGGGWWSYEFCHGRNVRQYHEVAMISKTESGAAFTSKHTDDEYWLGLYNEDIWDSIEDGDEWTLIVNATDSDKGGNGAYLEVEYTDGEICDHTDVTDAAIVAGTASVGRVARASSVRYYCGDSYDLIVNEDSTCHYVVEVRVPDLCKHPLFKVPVTKKLIVKCLPVEEHGHQTS